ncbi:MAG: hypothetical protein KI786_00195 [Mameliella sp.]|nr:hypothetical protein [Phaeodactylibacter sp.]
MSTNQETYHGRPYTAEITLPPLGIIVLELEKTAPKPAPKKAVKKKAPAKSTATKPRATKKTTTKRKTK